MRANTSQQHLFWPRILWAKHPIKLEGTGFLALRAVRCHRFSDWYGIYFFNAFANPAHNGNCHTIPDRFIPVRV